MAYKLQLKRGASGSLPTGIAGEPLFTTDTNDLYIGTGSANQRYQKYIASGTSSQFLKGDGSLDSNTYYLASNPSAYIALTALTASSPLSYNNTTGAFTIAQASGSVNGFLSSTDWTTFNNKQNTITNPVTGTGTTNYVPKFTSGSAIGNSTIQTDGSGNLMVGSANAGNAGTINVSVGVAGTTAGGLQLWAATNQTHFIQFGDGTTGAQLYAGYLAYAHSTDSLLFGTNGAAQMTLNASGNLGLGVVPSAWSVVGPVLQINYASFYGYQNQARVNANSYFDGSAFKYINTDFASEYRQASGQHIWLTAPSGTAGNAISFTQAMTLDASGNLIIGGTSLYGATITSYASATRSGGIGIRNSAGTIAGSFSTYAAGSGSGSTDIFVESAGFMAFASGGAERLRITSGGNVGVNCTATNAKLEVVATTGEVFRADAASGAYRIVATQTGVNMNGNVGINTLSPAASSLLDVTSTTQGFLPPRMTTTQKNAIGSPAAGLIVFDTTLVKLCVHNGTTWETITSL
jgi:hypothetical protein